MESDMAALAAMTERLKALGYSYDAGAGYPEAASERKTLLAGITPRIRRLELSSREFDRLLNAYFKTSFSSAAAALKARKSSAAASPDLADVRDHWIFTERCSKFRYRTRMAVHDERTAFESFSNRRSSARARLFGTLFGLAALLVLSLAAARLTGGRPAARRTPMNTSLAPGQRRDRPPALLGGKWRPGKPLGQPPLGDMWSAESVLDGSACALIRLRPEIVRSGDLEEFLAEARLWASLKHPHILSLHAVVREGEDCWLVEEAALGKPLSAHLRKDRPLPFAAAKRAIREAAAALAHAHARGVLHGDIKPACLLWTSAGPLKVADFGVSKRARLALGKTARGISWGSEPYLPPGPELAILSAQSDLFSLGVVFYEMITGLRSFPGPEYEMQKKLALYPLPSQFQAGLPPAVDAMLRRALAPNPLDRFRSAQEFLSALEVLG